jgi:iron complex transport system permease protein
LWVLMLVGAITLLLSIFIGRYPQPYWMSPSLLWNDELARQLVLHLRIPRIIAAFSMGMVLASAGATMQVIFRNPLVSSGFLGVSQGAAFGASLSIIFFSPSPIAVEATAAIFACSGLLVSYFLAWNIRYGEWVLRLVLAGIISSAIFSSGVGILKYMADPLSQLPDIVFWLMGGLWAVTWQEIFYTLPVVIPCLLLIYLMRWRLNLLALRDETASSLGASPHQERVLVLVAAVASTAVVVAIGGVVIWVGLIVPHIARRIVGSDAQRLLPASMLIGGIFTLVCDDLARTLQAGEIPLGIITALLGSAIFVYMAVGNELRVRR